MIGMLFQIWIQGIGRSRISQRGYQPIRGVPTYYLANFSLVPSRSANAVADYEILKY